MPGLLIPIIKHKKDTVKVGGPSGENSPLNKNVQRKKLAR